MGWRLEVVGLWSGTEGGSVDPKEKMGHRSARTKKTYEESEELKEAEMEVDDAVPQEAGAGIQSSKGKVIRVESEETHDYVCDTLAISQEEAEEVASCQAPLVNHERSLIGETIDAVKKPSDTGR